MSTGGTPPSTLDDVLAYVRALYVQMADPTTFEMGECFDGSEGAPPRIRFVVTRGQSALGPVLEVGARQLGSISEAVTCYVWGSETLDDADRYRDAKARVMTLLAAFNAAGVGRLVLRRLERGDTTSLITYGEQYQMEIAYVWAVPRSDAVDRAARALALTGASPPDPSRPNGDTGQTMIVNVVSNPTRP